MHRCHHAIGRSASRPYVISRSTSPPNFPLLSSVSVLRSISIFIVDNINSNIDNSTSIVSIDSCTYHSSALSPLISSRFSHHHPTRPLLNPATRSHSTQCSLTPTPLPPTRLHLPIHNSGSTMLPLPPPSSPFPASHLSLPKTKHYCSIIPLPTSPLNPYPFAPLP